MDKYSFSISKVKEEIPEKNEVNISREINRKLKNYLGGGFVKKMEKEYPGIEEEMEKYTQRFVLSEEQNFKEEFHFNLLRFEKEQPDFDIEKMKEELIHKTEVISQLLIYFHRSSIIWRQTYIHFKEFENFITKILDNMKKRRLNCYKQLNILKKGKSSPKYTIII